MNITSHEFGWLARFMYDRAAVVLKPGKEYLMTGRLAAVLRRENMTSFARLIAELDSGRNPALERTVIDALTTHETSFFRDKGLFETLRRDVFPSLLKAGQERKSLMVWSAACSTGQEPYTLAILLRDWFPEIVEDWHVTIVASDISAAAVARAEEGQYTQLEVSRGLTPGQLHNHFEKKGRLWRTNDDLQAMIDFRTVNLAAGALGVSGVDLVMLRNVLIYFDATTKTQVLRRIAHTCNRHSYLALGASESIGDLSDEYVSTQTSAGLYVRASSLH